MKSFFALLMTLCMLFALVPYGITAEAASNDTTLAVLKAGRIYEFRNMGDKNARLTFEGDEKAVVDTCEYLTSSGGNSSTARGWIYLVKGKYRDCNAGSMLVIEHRIGGSITVRGDASAFQVRELQTPALYVQTMSEGVTLEFVNSGSSVMHFVDWTWAGYPYETAGVGSGSMTYQTIHADGTSTTPENVSVNSGTGVEPGDTLVLQGKYMSSWPREVCGAYTVFSGQPYYLTINGEKSYPPNSIIEGGGSVQKPAEQIVSYIDNNGKTAQFKPENTLDWYLTNKSSTTYDPELAELAMALSAAAYDEKCIQDSFLNHGFSVTANRYTNQFNYLQPAYAIGAKVAENGDTTVAITICGSKSAADWLTDAGFIPAAGDNRHAGFRLAMESIISQLDPISTNGKTKFFITGHSYGAAVANLLAVELLNRGVPQSQVYAYTFATPNVTQAGMSLRNPNGKYNSIFNICNTKDPVSTLPTAVTSQSFTWGKYGRSYWFTLNHPTENGLFAAHSRYLYLDFMLQEKAPSISGNLGGKFTGMIASKYVATGILCPVDIDVSDNTGKLVAQFVSNQPKYLGGSEDNLLLYSIGDEKYVISESNTRYTYKMSATASGTMDYVVQEYDTVSGEISVAKFFKDVPLARGKQMTSDIGGSLITTDIQLFVTDVNGKVTDEIEGEVILSMPFTDVKPSDWFYTDVQNAYTSGLINGTSATIFSPNNNLTYAEAIKLAACMHQKYTTGSVALTNGSPWYQSYVDYAKANGIITKDYAWNTQATRGGYMDFFANALSDSALSATNIVPDGSIPDVPMTDPSSAAIYKLYRAGILQGVDAAHNCNPNLNIKRSEVAAILTRMMDSTARVSFSMN